MTITPQQYTAAKAAGAASSLDDSCPHSGLLARAWREGRRTMVAERRAQMKVAARGV